MKECLARLPGIGPKTSERLAYHLLQVEERGLHFWVDPGWDAPRSPRPGFGLFLDQRENRARLLAAAGRGGRWLNLFAHTGAFSVSLLAAGAREPLRPGARRRCTGDRSRRR